MQKFKAGLYPFPDIIYFDLKLMDDNAHHKYCGASNLGMLENFRHLQQWARNGGAPVPARVPLIPGITDTGDNLRAVAAFLKQCGAGRVQLLPYHPQWREKSRTIGRSAPMTAGTPLGQWLHPPEALAESKAIFTRESIST